MLSGSTLPPEPDAGASSAGAAAADAASAAHAAGTADAADAENVLVLLLKSAAPDFAELDEGRLEVELMSGGAGGGAGGGTAGSALERAEDAMMRGDAGTETLGGRLSTLRAN